jgi:hypothetical protein
VLTLPDVRQAHDFDCGRAAVDTLLLFYRLPLSAYGPGGAGLANPLQGMSPDTVEAALRACRLAVVSGTLTLADLRHYTRSRPVLTLTQWDGSGHWVTVAGVTARRVYFGCPGRGPQSLAVADWLDRWHDRGRYGGAFTRFGVVAWPERAAG